MKRDRALSRRMPVFLFIFAATCLLTSGKVRAQFAAGSMLLGGGEYVEPYKPFRPLVSTITKTIEPESWDKAGGAGSIRAVDHLGVVVVRQTHEVHEQIEQLIAALRQAKREQEAGDGMTPVKDADAPPAAQVLEEKANSDARKKIEAALASPAELSFIETPLADVVGQLKETYHISIELDMGELDGVGIGSDTPITRELSGVSLRSALRLILRDLDLCYTIRDEVLLITTPDDVEALLTTRIYRVSDLAAPVK